STSSSTELAAAAEQMSKLSRNLLDSMDRFVIDDGHSDSRRFPPRRIGGASERQSGAREYAEMART
ncbi:MAG: hypothetical protein WB723_05280, partial [Candidatus Acidiferrales bacterium]